jgi:hypothetical protein
MKRPVPSHTCLIGIPRLDTLVTVVKSGHRIGGRRKVFVKVGRSHELAHARRVCRAAVVEALARHLGHNELLEMD